LQSIILRAISPDFIQSKLNHSHLLFEFSFQEEYLEGFLFKYSEGFCFHFFFSSSKSNLNWLSKDVNIKEAFFISSFTLSIFL